MAKPKKDHIKDATDLLKAHLTKIGIDPESEAGLAQIKASEEELEALTVDKIIGRIDEARIFYDTYEYPGKENSPEAAAEKASIITQIIGVWTEYMNEAGADINTPESKAGLANLEKEMQNDDLAGLQLRLKTGKFDLERFKQSKRPAATKNESPVADAAKVIDSQLQDKETLEQLKKVNDEDLNALTASLTKLPSQPADVIGKPKVVAGQSAYLDTKTGQTHYDTIEQVRLIIKYNQDRFKLLA